MNVVAAEPNEQPDDTGPVDVERTETGGADEAAPGRDPAAGALDPDAESPDDRIRRRVGRIRWLTLLSGALSVLLAMAAAVPTTDRLLWTLLIVTSLQFAFVAPASLVLAEPKRWARTVLLVALPVSAVMWVVALTQTAWLLLPGNMLLVLAFVPLRDAEIGDFFRRHDRSLADIRAGR
ncbi:hypothetical protein FHS23_000610 [Prauserella isguenensis]|uniref:Uncharacterized protein n=1 Tax=Prauserella isguenensis TaxID=1470180 RepID=A0A839RWR9_9PSEU|nr:hypothetical protein [Prauserella isguenensis]MBB3049615.1 hypothetical protein [Prauserella isguenensis]